MKEGTDKFGEKLPSGHGRHAMFDDKTCETSDILLNLIGNLMKPFNP